jgi:hypothetical protein
MGAHGMGWVTGGSLVRRFRSLMIGGEELKVGSGEARSTKHDAEGESIWNLRMRLMTDRIMKEVRGPVRLFNFVACRI